MFKAHASSPAAVGLVFYLGQCRETVQFIYLPGITEFYFSRFVHQTVRLTTEFVDRCRNVCTLYKNLFATPAAVTSDLKQRLIDTMAWVSQNVIGKAFGLWRKRLHASMKAK